LAPKSKRMAKRIIIHSEPPGKPNIIPPKHI